MELFNFSNGGFGRMWDGFMGLLEANGKKNIALNWENLNCVV